MAVDWRIELIEAHPDLFHPPAGHSEQASGYPWCGVGWQDLMERLCTRIEAALREGETIQIVQLKEKFAGLRCYWRGSVSQETSARIDEAIALGEARAACTCEECGEVAQLYRHVGTYRTLCVVHGKGEAVTAEAGLEHVYVVRLPRSSSYGVARRRYDRQSDVFIDVEPTSPGLEEE